MSEPFNPIISQYVTSTEFLASPYGNDFQVGTSIFTSSGQIDTFLQYVSSLIDTYCGRMFGIQQYQDIFQGQDSTYTVLDFFPVTGVISIQFLNIYPTNYISSYTGFFADTSSGTIDPSYYYWYPDGRLKMRTEFLNNRMYTANYYAGYQTIPQSIKLATLMLANTYATSIDAGAVGFSDGGAITRFKFGKFQEDFSNPIHRDINYNQGIPPTVEAILRKFKYSKRV